jgi:hypothetical protein
MFIYQDLAISLKGIYPLDKVIQILHDVYKDSHGNVYNHGISENDLNIY